jgi:hypothetical protein
MAPLFGLRPIWRAQIWRNSPPEGDRLELLLVCSTMDKKGWDFEERRQGFREASRSLGGFQVVACYWYDALPCLELEQMRMESVYLLFSFLFLLCVWLWTSSLD